jgi:hypothetical protein
LMLLVRSAIDHIDSLPITEASIQRAITQARNTYRRTVEQDEWKLLAKVAHSKQIDNQDNYRKLLFNRCVLEYKYFNDQGNLQTWYDTHPLIRGIQQFKDSMVKEYSSEVEELFNSKVFAELEEPSRLYQKYLDRKDYAKAYAVANNAYNACEAIVNSLDSKNDRKTYLSAVAWSSYWKLKRDLYADQNQKEVVCK